MSEAAQQNPFTSADVFALTSVALDERRNLPRSPGVYFVYAKKTILYIGQSPNLYARWTAHGLTRRLRGLPNVRISWIGLETADCLRVESELIRQFDPLFNAIAEPQENFQRNQNRKGKPLLRNGLVRRADPHSPLGAVHAEARTQERDLIQKALEETGGSVHRAAKNLGLKRTTLISKIDVDYPDLKAGTRKRRRSVMTIPKQVSPPAR